MKRLAFFIPFQGCGRRCVYCDQEAITHEAGTASPDIAQEALMSESEPVELCYFGGSFARLPFDLLLRYLGLIDLAPAGSVVTFSSYPGDFAGPEGARRLAVLEKYPVGTVELGIPTLDPVVLRECGRDDDIGEILSVVRKLKGRSFRLGIQIMTGLPGQTRGSAASGLETLATLKGGEVWDLRIYPCLVLRGTELHERARRGAYKPQSLEEAICEAGELMLRATALGFRVIRVGLHDSPHLCEAAAAGPYHPAFGELARAEALALQLVREAPRGPWKVAARIISQLTGHGGRGILRLAELSGLPLETVRSLLDFHPPK